jgi:hypothetical protein
MAQAPISIIYKGIWASPLESLVEWPVPTATQPDPLINGLNQGIWALGHGPRAGGPAGWLVDQLASPVQSLGEWPLANGLLPTILTGTVDALDELRPFKVNIVAKTVRFYAIFVKTVYKVLHFPVQTNRNHSARAHARHQAC